MTAAATLLAALRAKAGSEFVHRAEVTPWCSVDRTGARHVFDLAFRDRASADRLLIDLNDHEFALPNDVVADIHAYARADGKQGIVEITVETLTFPSD